MPDKKKKREDFDTETSFTNMNVEGFSWYDPHKKQDKQKQKVSRKEYWQMVRSAYKAYLPVIAIIIAVGIAMYLLACIWLGG